MLKVFFLAQAAIFGAFLQQRTIAASLISTSARFLVTLLARNEHVRAAGRAALRGATQELIRHLQTNYGAKH